MTNINAQFNYSANFGPVIGQMQKLTAEANLLNNTLQNLDKQSVGLKQNLAASFASDLGKVGGYNAKMIELTNSVDQFGQSLLKQKFTLKEYAKEAIGAFTSSSNSHKLAVREVAREMSQLVTLGKGMDGKQMGMMITPATINLKNFNTQLAVSQKQWSIFNSLVQDGTTHLINFGKNTQWAGRQITVGLTVPLSIYGNAVSKIFREVDAELTRFQKVYGSDLMNSTSESTKNMVDDVRNLAIEFSKSFGIAAKETASLAADLAATGLEGQKLLASIRETTRLALLGDVSNQDAMKTTLSLQNAFKISTDELASSVNFLNAVENQTSLSLQDLTTAIPKAGPVVKALGGDVKDLSLLMVALKEGGISAAEGANALKSGMASLINPTKQASITAKQYGIDINGIVQANRGQLMPTIIAFQQQLQLLDDFGKAQVIENVFGKYQFARISALFDNLNASASQTNAVLDLMGKSNKELAATAYQEMDTLMNSSSKHFQRTIEGIKAQFISIGGSITASITPILENVMGKIGKAIEFFQNLPKPVKSFIKVATGLTAIAGPIIMMVGIFSNFLGYIGKGAMGMVNLGRRMAGIPTQKFEMLTDTQIMAQKATEQLATSFDRERSSVERLNQALGIYKQNLADAISLNPAFINRQVASIPTTTPTAKLQRGGSPFVPGSGSGDKVPAMLEPGEYVVNKKAAAKYSGTLDQMNFQSAPRFQKGGRMPGYADTSMLPYKSIYGQGKKAEPFIGPLPQISYNLQGTYKPGYNTTVLEYPFSSRESAESLQSTDPREYAGSGSRITRQINDSKQKAYADYIEGHNMSQFRPNSGQMKREDMSGHRQSMLDSMAPIKENVSLYRGTVLREKGNNEFSGMGARELLFNIKYGKLEKSIGKRIEFSDLQSFSSNPNIASYSKFIDSVTNPSNANSKKAADRKLESMAMLPVIFRIMNARGQSGFNLSANAMVQEVMGKPVNEQEYVLNKPSGTITGIRQDIGTRNHIIDLMQNGGRVQSAAGGRIKGYADESLMPEKYSKKMKNIQSIMDATSQEASGGMYAGMPMTDIGNLVDRIGGRSAAIPGASGIYEQGGNRSVVKGHNTATSARIEAIASALTRSVFGLESPVQEFIKFAHPETSSAMFGVRSPFDAKFAKTSGKIGAGDFFMQALSAIIRGDSDLQPDNLYDGIVVDQGAGYGSDRASQPRGLTGKKFSVGDQAKVNFLMQKGGARRWFTEATAGIASGMTREQYIGGFMQAISTAQAKFPAAMASLAGMNLTKEEQQIFGVLAGDLQGAQGIDWGSIYDSHIGVTPEVKKPVTEAAAAKALLTKQANKEEYQKAIDAGYPSYMGYAQGGRVNGYADNSTVFAHSVPSQSKGPIRLHYPIGFNIPRDMNEALRSSKVKKQDLIGAINKPGSTSHMSGFFNSFARKNPKAGINSASANIVKSETLKTLKDAPPLLNDPMLYAESLQSTKISEMYKEFKKSEFLSDFRANISEKTLLAKGFKKNKNGQFVSPDGKMVLDQIPTEYGYKYVEAGGNSDKALARSVYTGRQRSFTSNPVYDILMGNKSIKKQSGGRINGYASETTSWAKKAAAPKAYAGVLQGIPNWATKPNEYQAIVEALRSSGVPESDRLASFYIQDVLAHINPSTTNANGIYEKVWSAANLMKDSQVYNVFLETLRTRKDIGGLLNPSTVSRVAGASGLSASIVQTELTKIADGVHPNTANGAKVMMTLARMFPSRTSPGMPIAVAAGMGARLQGNFYDTLGQRALPLNLPNTTVRAYDPKGNGAPTSTGQGSRVRSTGLIMPSGAIRPSMVMPNIQSIPSAAGGTGTSATVKVDGMGNVLSNSIDDMVAHTITGQPIAVSSKELLAIGPGGGIAGVTSPGDEARGNIVYPMGTALMRGKTFQQKRLKGFNETSQQFGVPGGLIGPATSVQAAQQAQNTEPVYQREINPGGIDKFAAGIGFLTSGVYTLQTAFQQFTATTADGADKFTKMAAATTFAITGIQGVSQMLVYNGKIQAMQNKADMMQSPGKGKMSSGMGKMLGVGSKALGMLGGPMGMLATSVAVAAVNKGIAMYQAAVQKAKAAGAGMFKDPIEGAKLLGITLKDTSSIVQTYSKISQGLGMKSTGKGAYDKTYAEVVKKDYSDLIDSLKVVLNQEEKRNKLLLTYINLTQKGFNKEDAKAYVQEISRQSGAMSAFNSINLDSLKTTTDIANQTVASTKALMSSIGKVDSNLIGKYINKKTGTIYNTREQMMQEYTKMTLVQQTASMISGGFASKIDKNTGKTLSAGILGSMSSLGLDEKQLGEAIAGALKTAYSIAATDPSAANQAGAMIIENIAKGTQKQQEAANASILEMMKEAGASSADLGYNFVLGGGLTKMANDVEGQFAGMGPRFSNAILSAIQSGNIDMVNEMLRQSSGELSPEAISAFVNKLARVQALAKIDLEIDIQLEQTKKQLELIKTELGKTFDILIASKQAEVEIENKRHEQAMKNLDNEGKRLNDKKDILQRNTDYYIKELEREKQAEDYYANQRKTGLSGLKAISSGDVFGFIGAQMDAATSADQFGRDLSMQAIQETADAGQKKLDEDLRAIDNRKEAEAGRHEAELANIEAEIEFLNKKRAVSVGAAEKAISKIEKVVAMSPSDPGYQAAVQEAMSLATTAGMQASQVLQNADTSSMTKEELTYFNKVKEDLGLAITTFKTDTETALYVLSKDIEPIVANIKDSLGAAGNILSQVVVDLNKPVKPGSAIAAVAELAGINVGTSLGGVTGNPTAATNQFTGGASGRAIAPNFASGGMLYGPGTGTSDSIPVMASNGEYIIKADVVKRIGKVKLDQINGGNFAYGGMVGSMPGMSSAPGMATGGFVGSMPSYSSAPGMAAGGFIGNSAPSTPKYNISSAGGGMSPAPIARMARGGQINSSSSNVNSSPVMNFNGAGMDMVMHHVNKQMGGRISSNSRRIG